MEHASRWYRLQTAVFQNLIKIRIPLLLHEKVVSYT